jgi:hypothetical protein
MGSVHNELSRGELSRALKNSVGATRGGGIERYGETLQPVIDLWRQPEHRFLRSEHTYSRGTSVAAGAAGTFAGVCLICRASQTGKLFVVQAVSVSPAANTQVSWGTTTEATADANFPSQLAGTALDLRSPQTAPIRIGFGTPAGAVTPFGQGSFANLPQQYVRELEGVVLTPGFAVFVQTQDDAAVLIANFTWRERQAYPGEF